MAYWLGRWKGARALSFPKPGPRPSGQGNARGVNERHSMIDAELAFDALGDATRRQVFRRLRKGTLSVREIAEGMAVSRPAVSQHLKVLREAGLVVVRTEGARRLYGVNARGLESIRDWLDGFWDDTLAAFKAAAEREAAKESKP
ncbi:MAG TPA: metalloregulator ArsR/SmtB family transcription factor [Polyangiaceae bacterium]|nr:metalloregulator ArsR/SmtB family transcription factor [Polyangiaceae bacterium]